MNSSITVCPYVGGGDVYLGDSMKEKCHRDRERERERREEDDDDGLSSGDKK